LSVRSTADYIISRAYNFGWTQNSYLCKLSLYKARNRYFFLPFYLLAANNRTFGMNRASNCYTSLHDSSCGATHDVRQAAVHRLQTLVQFVNLYLSSGYWCAPGKHCRMLDKSEKSAYPTAGCYRRCWQRACWDN